MRVYIEPQIQQSPSVFIRYPLTISSSYVVMGLRRNTFARETTLIRVKKTPQIGRKVRCLERVSTLFRVKGAMFGAREHPN